MLEKLVHVEDPELLPPLVMMRYAAPDDLGRTTLKLAYRPETWKADETWSQGYGDAWHEETRSAQLQVPSVILPIYETPDFNILINHRHPDAARISLASAEPFVLDARFF